MDEPRRERPQEYVDPRPDAVVRPLARAGGRTCARPGCPAPASATLIFDYPASHASLGVLDDRFLPESYDLCGHHADRTGAPIGWLFEDLRPEGMRPAPAPGGAATIAILSAVLDGDASDGDGPLLHALESVDLLLGGGDGDPQRRVIADAQDTIDELQAFVAEQDTMEELRALLASPHLDEARDEVVVTTRRVAARAPANGAAHAPQRQVAAPSAPASSVIPVAGLPLGVRAQAW